MAKAPRGQSATTRGAQQIDVSNIGVDDPENMFWGLFEVLITILNSDWLENNDIDLDRRICPSPVSKDTGNLLLIQTVDRGQTTATPIRKWSNNN